MNLVIGGGVGEHGRNCFYVADNICYAVDCGIMRGSVNPYPRLSDEQIKSIKYLFLTHSHEDHIGAFSYFVKRGFKGIVIGTAATLSAIPRYGDKFVLPQKKSVISLSDIVFSFGRSGHCVGAVWYRISTCGGSALFSGDYSEESAFNVDKINNLSADVAILDCAFGDERYNAEEQLAKIIDYTNKRNGVIFPVPKNGRAVDLIARLCALGKQIYIDCAQSEFLKMYLKNDFWVKRYAAEMIRKSFMLPLTEFKGEGIAFISDAQLVKEESAEFVNKCIKGGATILLTGYTDKGSFAERLLTEGKAEKIPFNAHCNKQKADEIAARNNFEKVIYYHCDTPDYS